MFGSQHKWASLACPAVAVALLIAMFAACVPVTVPVAPSSIDTPAPAPATPTMALPTESPVAEPLAPTESVTVAMIPGVGHSLEGRERCLLCHAVDGNIHPAPADHEGWAADFCFSCHLPAEESALLPELPAVATLDFCLGCHGPFERVMAATVDYVTPRDSAVNPHIFVPHDSKTVLECRRCHGVHPLPLMAPEELAPANVGYCYMACHHTGTFQPCTECH